ncbi:MAG: hypothetical protein ACRD5M_04990 [Candidatus Acidiferrales bacterium]
MKYSVYIRIKEPEDEYPHREYQDNQISSDRGDFIPLPIVGDSISFVCGGETKYAKVLTRHFDYIDILCRVDLVVAEIPDEEVNARTRA